MGCCSCTYKTRAYSAAIFGLIQAIVGLVLNGFFLHLYNSFVWRVTVNKVDKRLFLLYVTQDIIIPMKGLLGVAACLNSIWIISSVVLLIGNVKNSAYCVRQWVIITAFIIIGDLILPAIVIGLTMDPFMSLIRNTPFHSSRTAQNNMDSNLENSFRDIPVGSYMYYIILLFCFFKLAIITISINICLNVCTNRRASQIIIEAEFETDTPVAVIIEQGMIRDQIQETPGSSILPVEDKVLPMLLQTGSIPPEQTSDLEPPIPESPPENVSDPTGDEQTEPLLPPQK